MELNPHYHIVRFSPVPEISDAVAVGILLIDERPRLISDFEFQKLTCTAPDFNKRTLRFWIEDISESLRDMAPNEAAAFISSRSAQFQLSSPRRLDTKFSDEIEQFLIQKLLRRPAVPHKLHKGESKYIDSLVDQTLHRLSVDSDCVLKRAKPRQFLSRESLKLLPDENFRFSRVVVGVHGIVLMDGINLHLKNKSELQRRVNDVGFGFYSMGQVKDRIQSQEGRKLTRAALVFDGRTLDSREQYFTDMLKSNSDLLIHPEDEHGLDQLELAVKDAQREIVSIPQQRI